MKHPNGGVPFFKYRLENSFGGYFILVFCCFFFFFVYRNEQVCSFLIVESLSEFCIGNFICISGITCELII